MPHPTAHPAARGTMEEGFLDAAERLLVRVGYAGVTTRILAEEAGANHGLVHYYFGSVENLFVRVLERFTARLIVRQREMYAADMRFLEKWRRAMTYLQLDREYQKVWLELQALSWNRPGLRDRVATVNEEWRAVLTEAFAGPREELAIEMPLDALVSLVMTFNEGIILERSSGIETGHRALLDWIDAWLQGREAERTEPSRREPDAGVGQASALDREGGR
jgi:AcrR family transcriptional regulator